MKVIEVNGNGQEGSDLGNLRLLKDLDQKDTTILKALAIAAIVFHNFFHLVVPVHENEFTFDPARFGVFLDTVRHPSLAIQALFAFYGHLGVQIFIFLSAYGLAKSHWSSTETWTEFMRSRIRKLYPMFGLAILFWAFLVAIHIGPEWLIKEAGPKILLMLAGVSPFVPGMGLPLVGPWWFIPFIVQFYAIWPLLRKTTIKFGWPGLVVLGLACFFLTRALNPALAHWSLNLGLTPIGRMRVICLGILAARYPVRFNTYLAIPALAILILGGQNVEWAHFVSLAAVVFALWLYMNVRGLLRKSRALEKIGEYSLAIFLINGIVRIPFVMFARTPQLQLLLACASALVTFAISAFFHYLLAERPGAVKTLPTVEAWTTAEATQAIGD